MGVALAMLEEYPDLQQAKEAARRSLNKTIRENIRLIEERNRRENARHHDCPDCPAARCEESCPRYLAHYASQAEFWDWWGRTSPPDRKEKDAILHLPAPATHGGGSKSKRKKKAKKLSELRKYALE